MAPKSKDREATKAANFVCRLSRINLDGTVELHGFDMSLLRARCFERDDWKCVEKDCRTPREWIQMDHIIPRGSNGVDRDDKLENVQTLCVNHHALKHPRVRLGASA